ncbi:MAG: NAD(P)/FAD-dependent oxidoreductase [Desulfobulbaceae bacterium]
MSRPGVIVVGGGAAGLMAAGQAARAGAEVVLVEKMKRPGRKICITGKGRCNLTNVAELEDFLGHFGKNGRFLRQAFGRFFSAGLMEFFRELGLELTVERGGRVFPASGKAPDVLAVLVRWLEECGVQIRTGWPVDTLLVEGGRIQGVAGGDRRLEGERVILATGGASYPATGSTGDGYRLAEAVGHTIVPVRPALVPLVTAGKAAPAMAGLQLRNTGVRLFIDNRKRGQAFGELAFTDFGVSGPVILTLSGKVVDALREGRRVELRLDLKPALDERRLDARLLRDLRDRSGERMESMLRGLLPREMVGVCLGAVGVSPGKRAGEMTAPERKRLRAWLKDFRLEVVGHRPLAEAIVTAGGVELREVDPRTMESKIVKGLYLAGEVLDIQGDTGGYNLQAAFSTGWLAGRSAAGSSGRR